MIYDFFGCIASARGPLLATVIRALTALRAAPLLNAIVRARMKHDPFVSWGVSQGYHVFGVKRPYNYFKETMEYSTKKISRLVIQDVLLLAGTHDHFVPTEMLYRQAKALTSVRSLTCRLFTEAEFAQSHCQVGNIELALSCIVAWMDEMGDEKRSERPMNTSRKIRSLR